MRGKRFTEEQNISILKGSADNDLTRLKEDMNEFKYALPCRPARPTMLFAIVFTFLLISLSACPGWGQTYYVKSGGNDSAAGTSDRTAWATVSKVTATVKSGDTVYFRSQDTWQATSGSRILVATAGVTYIGNGFGTGTRAKFQAIGDGGSSTIDIVSIPVSNVIFRGFEIDGQNYWNYGIWVGSSATNNISNIVVDNNEVHNIMREPGNDSGYWGYGIHVSSKAGQGPTTSAGRLTSPDGDAANPSVASSQYTFVAGDVGKPLVINTEGTGFVRGSYTITAVSSGSAVLDRPCGSDGPITGGNWWFKGINVSNVSITNNIVRNCNHEGIALYQAWGYPTNATHNVLVSNNQVYNNNTGILIANDSDNVTVEHNDIYKNTAQGIYIRVTSPVFDLYYPYGPKDMIVRYNYIRQNVGFGIYLGTPGIKITGSFYNNLFYNNGTGGSNVDGAEFFMGGSTGYTYADSELYIYNNTFYSAINPNTNLVGTFLVGVGGTDIRPATIVFKNNIVMVGSGITQSAYRPILDRWNLLIHSNNLIYRASSATAAHVVVSYPAITYDRNGGAADLTKWEATAKKTDPLFVSTVTPDFHLQAGSPAINAGVSVGLTTDYLGNAIAGLPDIGAYEFQSSSVQPMSPTGLKISE